MTLSLLSRTPLFSDFNDGYASWIVHFNSCISNTSFSSAGAILRLETVLTRSGIYPLFFIILFRLIVPRYMRPILRPPPSLCRYQDVI